MSSKEDSTMETDFNDMSAVEPESTPVRPQRTKTLTEKGLAYQGELNVKCFMSKRASWTTQKRILLKMIGQCMSVSQWSEEYGKGQMLFDEYEEMYENFHEIAEGDDLTKMKERYERDYNEWSNLSTDFRAEISRVKQHEQHNAGNDDVSMTSRKSSQSKSCRSERSCLTKTSSSSSAKLQRLELAKQEAALKVKLEFAEEEKKLKLHGLDEVMKAEAIKIDHSNKLEQLQLEKELAENRAVMNVLASLDQDSLSSSQLASIPADKDHHMYKFLNSQEDCAQLNPDAKPFSPVEQEQSAGVPLVSTAREFQSSSPVTSPHPTEWNLVASSLEKCITHLTEASKQQNDVNMKLAVSSQLPKISVPVFSGDPLQYPLWKNSFNALIDSQPLDPDTKLNYLNQYVTGKPKHLVEHYLLIGTPEAYTKARDVLAERYGNSSIISTAFTNKLRQWTRVTPRDSSGLREFADFLRKVEAASITTPSLGVLNYASENVHLVEKLPYYLEGKWRDQIEKWRRHHGQSSFPPFTEFVQFVCNAAEKANIPELESLTRDQVRQRSGTSTTSNTRSSKGQMASSFSTATRQSDQRKANESCSCMFCGKRHFLDECEEFIHKPFKDRKDFFFKKRLCMGCAVSSEHQVRACPERKSCKTCKGAHLTCLHRNTHEVRERRQPQYDEPEVTVNCTNVCSIRDQDGCDLSMIVPVWVRHKDDPSTESLEYAILDDQSNVGFVSDNLCDRLNVTGPKTNLLLTTMQEKNASVASSRICGLQVLDFEHENMIELPMCFTRDVIPANRSQIPKTDVAKQWVHLKSLADKMMPYDATLEVSLLIGNNCARAVRPREIIAGGEDDPYGQRSLLGWGIIGDVCQTRDRSDSRSVFCNKVIANESSTHRLFTYGTQAKEIFNADRVLRILESDFNDTSCKNKPYSIEDARFMTILETGIKKRLDGHYEMPLPLKSDNIYLPYNKSLAEKRWNQLNARFRKKPKFNDDYKAFMSDIIANCAEKVPTERLEVKDGKINYVPHTGVYHPKKPDKIRVVFDCSAQYGGVCLNDYLLQGPDTMNGLLGILCRFRQEEVAFMTDIKGMFHQFHVAEKDRDLLRFLWWDEDDPNNDVVDYRMTVHLFGAGSSPGCANFGLRRAADDGEEEYGVSAAEFIRNDFYVDDGLKSVPTVEEAVNLIKASQKICAKAGMQLHKIMSNKKTVLESVPADDRAKGVKDLDLKVDPLPIERALGVTWCVENDSFQFRIELRDRPFTRRGVLSTVSSIYDPSGYVAPVTLKGKQILQQMCRDKLDWDSPIPDNLRPLWERWRLECIDLELLTIPRCFKPVKFGTVKTVELHYFSDASEEGYGQCTYLRLVNERDEAHCSFVLGKARVTPLKHVTIPRLELAAATLSAKTSEFLRAELSYTNMKEFFWTDSMIVLGYVANEAKRFHVYVANRVQQIRNSTNPGSWLYVDTKLNPADEASRGLSAKQLVEESCWLTGPEFLKKNGPFQTPQVTTLELGEGDPEVKRTVVLATRAQRTTAPFPNHLEKSRFDRFSRWYRAKKAVALCLKIKESLRQGKIKPISKKSGILPLPRVLIGVPEMQAAERAIIKCIQQEHFKVEMQALQQLGVVGEVTKRECARARNQAIKKTSSLYRLDPFLDDEGVIRVGGRIDKVIAPTEVKHPVILPRRSHISELIIKHVHEKVNHMGRGTTHNELRQRGYWIINGSSAVSHYISKCVICRRYRGSLLHQKMANLPEDRLQPSPPFSFSAVDYFGPFLIKERRSEVKRYGVLFTCMSSRAIHLETAQSLTTSSFINALRRFLSRRGSVRQIRCDQGTNFVGARNELRKALAELSDDEVKKYLLQNDCDWIPFKMNPPHSSHMGGTWERQIRTVRSVLMHLLSKSGTQLDDEAFRTFMTEVEGIVNSRPLTTSNLNSPDAPEPLTPNHLLTMKTKVVLPPPGRFQREDLYSLKWWRRVQYLANQFWLRWRKEFLGNLQLRQKWELPQRNLMVGDVVIIRENESDSRNEWPLARVAETFPSEDGRVRKVKLMMAEKHLDRRGRRNQPPTLLDRPVHKMVLLVPVQDGSSDTTEDNLSTVLEAKS